MSELRLRTARAEDFPAIALIGNAAWPDVSVTAVELLARDARRRASRTVRRRVAVQGGRIVGWSIAEWSPDATGPAQLSAAVLPAARGAGVGAALWVDAIEPLVAGGVSAAVVEAREHQLESRRFLESRGATLQMRYAVSRLDLTRFDRGRFAGARARVEAAGVCITTAAALRATQGDAIARINALRWTIAQQVPAVDPPVRESDASLATYLDTQPTALPHGWFIARAGDVEIGLSTLWRSLADPTVVHTGVTGVLPEWRRQGVATALKLAAIEYARSIGARRINTDNEENNPMYRLNLMLGFEPQPAWLAYQVPLASA